MAGSSTQMVSPDFRVRLAAEVDTWRRDGVITPQQAEAILERYQASGTATTVFRLAPLTNFLTIAGSIVVGLGLVLAFTVWWPDLPRWFRVVSLLGGPSLVIAIGSWMQFRWKVLPRTGAALILLGTLLFQAALFPLVQLFGKPIDSPPILLAGSAVAVLLAYRINSRAVLTFGLLDALAWLGTEMGKTYQSSPQNFAIPLVYVLAGVVIYAASRRQRPKGYEAIYQVLGLLAILIPSYVLSFGFFWHAAEDQNWAGVHPPLWFGIAVLVSMAAAGTLAVGRRDWTSFVECGTLVAAALVVGLTAYRPGWAGAYALLFNAVFFWLAIFTCVRGYLDGAQRFVNAGLALLTIGILTRYTDMFWGRLPTSAFFLTGGAVLLGGGTGVEYLRRRLLRSMESKVGAPGAYQAH